MRTRVLAAFAALSLSAVAFPVGNELIQGEKLKDIARANPTTFLKKPPPHYLAGNKEVRQAAVGALSAGDIRALTVDCFKQGPDNMWFFRDNFSLLEYGKLKSDDVLKVFKEEHPDLTVLNIHPIEFHTDSAGRYGKVINGVPAAFTLLTVQK